MKTIYKQIILLFVFCFSIFYSHAETIDFTTTQFAYCINGLWSDWEYSNVLIRFDINTNYITIQSDELQIYKIYKYNGKATNDEGKSLIFRAFDKDDIPCIIKFRIQNDDIMQLYIYYPNFCWVYVIEKL